MSTEKRPPLVVDVGETMVWVQNGRGWLLGGGGWRPMDEDNVPSLGGRVLLADEVAKVAAKYGNPAEVRP